MSFPRYPEYKSAGVKWLGKIPAHWSIKPLKNLASFNDEVLPDNTSKDLQIKYVEISDVDAHKGIVSSTPYTFGSAPSRARRRVTDGDILVSTVRTYLRAIAPVQMPPYNLVVSTGFAVIRPDTAYFQSTLMGYMLRAEWFISNVIASSVGVSYPAINASDLVRFSIPVPPVEEQAQIATFLDHETAQIDALIEEQKRLIELLKEKRQALISHAVTKGLDPDVPMKDSGVEWLSDVPAHWRVERIANLFEQANDDGSEDLPVLRVSIHYGVSDRELNEEESDRKITRIEDKTKYKKVVAGDLVYNMMRAWQGGFGAVSVDGLVSPAYVVARPIDSEIRADYVELVLRTPFAVEEMRRFSYGITDFRLRLYWEQFRQIRIPVPPRNESVAILEEICRLKTKSTELQAECERQVALLKERRSSLISAAVTGRIDVRDWQAPVDAQTESCAMAAKRESAHGANHS